MKPHALLTATDKTGLVVFAERLLMHGYVLLSTSKTAACLREAGIRYTDIAEYTGQEALFGGRMKALHQMISAGIFARNADDDAELAEKGWARIDVVACNPYDFASVSRKATATLDEGVNSIDIAGVNLLREAATNFSRTTVIIDPEDYTAVMAAMHNAESLKRLRLKLAAKVFRKLSYDDRGIAEFLESFIPS